MKIVHVVYSLEMGGAEVLVGQLCRMQRANGHSVSVCSYSRLGTVGEGLRSDGFAIFVPGEAHPVVTMGRYLLHFLKLRPDVVHMHNVAPTIQAALAARLAGAKSVVSTRHSLVAAPYDLVEERKYNAMARFCDWIVGICDVTCENLRGVPGAYPGKIRRVYNGATAIERESFAELGKNGFTLVFVGRLAAVKDLETLIRAVAVALKQVPELRLWMVGDGPMRGELEALVESLGIADQVRFWGQRLDTAKFFSAADAFCMSSVSEGLPMSLLQAMSVGVPTIVTDVGGMAEVVKLAGCGLVAPVGDAEGYAKQIVRLATEAGMREGFAETGRVAYAKEFTLERMDAGYMAIYDRNR
jgi:glycosyltransferase involved in cell wall biosynthesis